MIVEHRTTYSGNLVVEGDLLCKSIAVDGDLIVSGDLRARRSLHVSGNVTVGKSLHVGLGLRAGGAVTVARSLEGYRIEAAGTVQAGEINLRGAIISNGSILSAGSIEASGPIRAASRIKARGFVFTPTFEIACAELHTQQLPFGRHYWAGIPALAPWRDQILDENLCWDELRGLLTDQDREGLASMTLGHWSLDGQFRSFLGVHEMTVPPAEAQTKPKPVEVRVVQIPPKGSVAKPLGDATNILAQIVTDPLATYFPDYAENASYQAILAQLRSAGLLAMDLRAAYPDLDIQLGPIYSVVNGMTVADPTVKAQILAELAAADNIRSLQTNVSDFVTNSILSENLKVQYVGGMVKMEDNDAVTFDVVGVLTDILGGLEAVPLGSAAVTVLQGIFSLIQTFSGGIDSVDAKYDELVGALSAQFDKLLNQNAQMAQTLLTDWGKMQQANALIIDGTLAWPADSSAAITAASNIYEIGVFKTLLPIHWAPIFSYYNYPRDTRENCNGTVWMQIGGWGRVEYRPSDPWIPYWMTYGMFWEGDLSVAEAELARIGVSIEDLTMGTGLWGPEPFAYEMAHPVGAWDVPKCVKKH